MRRFIAVGMLLLASCSGSAITPVPQAAIPSGFQVSDTQHWLFGYPSGWTTDETTGTKGEHMFNVRGPQVSTTGRCFAFAVWQDNYQQDLVSAIRSLLVLGGPDQQIIANEEFAYPGARQALRIERVYQATAKDGSTAKLHAYELHFLRNDNVAIGFDVTVPADHTSDCKAVQIFQTFTMKSG